MMLALQSESNASRQVIVKCPAVLVKLKIMFCEFKQILNKSVL